MCREAIIGSNLWLFMLFLQGVVFCQSATDIGLISREEMRSKKNFLAADELKSNQDQQNHQADVFPYDGTYQFVFLNGKRLFFSDEIVSMIQQNRKKRERVELYLSDHCKVIILSEEEINSPEFIPFDRPYIFE